MVIEGWKWKVGGGDTERSSFLFLAVSGDLEFVGWDLIL